MSFDRTQRRRMVLALEAAAAALTEMATLQREMAGHQARIRKITEQNAALAAIRRKNVERDLDLEQGVARAADAER